MRFSAAIAAILLLATCARAQSLSLRTISRTTDVLRTQQIDAFAWYSGERVVYDVYPRVGTNNFFAPTNTVPIWFVTDRAASNYYVMVTGRVVGVTNGPIQFELPSALSALPPRLYESFSAIYGGDPTAGATRVVIDRAQVQVERNASYDGVYVGPIPPTNSYPLDAATPVLQTFWTANAAVLRDALGVDDATGLWSQVYYARNLAETSTAAIAAAQLAALAEISNALTSVRLDVGSSWSNVTEALSEEIGLRGSEDDAIRAELRGVVISNAISVRTSGGWHAPEYAASLDYETMTAVAPSSNEVVDISLDSRFVRNYSDHAAVGLQMYAVGARNETNAPVVWSVEPTNRASIDTNGFVMSLGSGAITATVQVGSYARSVSAVASVDGYHESDWQIPGPTGFWRRIIVTSVYARVSNATDNAVWEIFDPSNRVYRYAVTGMMAGVDMSAFGVDTSFYFYHDWNARRGAKRPGGALVTPLHYLTTWHNEMRPGDTVRLIARDNSLVERTIVATRYVLYPSIGPDLVVAQLDAPITNITPVRVMGRFYGVYSLEVSPHGANGPRMMGEPYPIPGPYLPTLYYGQYGTMSTLMWAAGRRQAPPIEPWLRAWYRQPIVGDSGSPVITLHGDEAILLGLMTSNDGSTGDLIGRVADDVNAAIADLCGDCGLTLGVYDDYRDSQLIGAPIPHGL